MGYDEVFSNDYWDSVEAEWQYIEAEKRALQEELLEEENER